MEPAQGRLKSQVVSLGELVGSTWGLLGTQGLDAVCIAEARTKKAAWRPTIVKISPVKLCSARAFDGAENHD